MGATNIAVQDVCPGRVVSHGEMLYKALPYQLVVDVLSHAGTANPGRLPFGKCADALLPGVTADEVYWFNTVVAADVIATTNAAAKTALEPPLRDYAQ
ncbi:hypothetical protein [Streptomyces sp. NPDC057580]|uniref:hypothetical protein n=1 Tax=Streptomyces sp. NPDC057580 TaxID=3346173 RepID=UPI0036B70B03